MEIQPHKAPLLFPRRANTEMKLMLLVTESRYKEIPREVAKNAKNGGLLSFAFFAP
jgi:hypothetical protein